MNYRAELELIKYSFMTGQITYGEAKEKAQPIIDEMNIKGKEIAKKYNQRFKPFTFSYLMR
jgi:hypothetical protein